MISRDLAAPGRRARILRVAIALSLVVHLVAMLVAFGAYDAFERLLPRHAPQRARLDDETVTLSTAIRFEKRPKAAASHPIRAAAVVPASRAEPKPLPLRVAAVPHPIAARKPKRPAAPKRRELAKIAPRSNVAERRVAIVQHPPATSTGQSHSATLSAAQLARIQSDLATPSARDRSRENPLSNVTRRVTPASTMRRYAINVAGTRSVLRGAQGICTPQQTWNAAGYVYFYVTCRTQRADGSVRNEAIPWPLRFRPSQVVDGADGPAPPPGEIPLPLPGWELPASQYIDPDVLAFLRERRSAARSGANVREPRLRGRTLGISRDEDPIVLSPR